MHSSWVNNLMRLQSIYSEIKTYSQSAATSIEVDRELGFNLVPITQYVFDSFDKSENLILTRHFRWARSCLEKTEAEARIAFLAIQGFADTFASVVVSAAHDSAAASISISIRKSYGDFQNALVEMLMEFLVRDFGVPELRVTEVVELDDSADEESESYAESEANSSVESSRDRAFRAEHLKPSERILTAGPLVTPLEISNVLDAAKFGWNHQHSGYLSRFEEEFAARLGVKFALATSSGTGALHLSLMAAGIGQGDEVIVPDISWVASASAIRYVGAKPIFAEISADSWTLDPEKAESLITKKTKAIMPVHLYGFPSDMTSILELAKRHGLVVVEDAAPAIGAAWNGQPVGTFGEFGCFSFQGAKVLVTGEGGMIVTDDDFLYARAKKLQEHGRRPGTFWIDELGYKYKMSNLQAAFGLGQLEWSDYLIEKKHQIRNWYRELLEGQEGIKFQESSEDGIAADWMTSICLPDWVSRNDLISYLDEQEIDSRPVFPQMSSFSFWETRVSGQRPIAEMVASNGVNLPSGVRLTFAEVSAVAKAITEFLRKC